METKEILKAIEEKQPQLRSDFWTRVHEILRKDCTQASNDATGTKIRITKDSIIIESGISNLTLNRLMDTGYLVSATEEGKIEIHHRMMGRSQ